MKPLTEEEARKKWCPMARVSINAEHFHGGNRFEPISDVPNSRLAGMTNCIASDCMMWRTAAPTRTAADFRQSIPPLGFCGLAGPPEVE